MRRFRISVLVIMFILPEILWAQKVQKVSGEYIYYAPSTITLDQARQIALDRAKIQLIADEFGTIVSSTNITRMANTNGDSDIQMTTLGESEVKGEWIETIGEPKYEIGYENDMLYVKVSISGRIREIVSASIDIKAKLLRNGTEDKFESEEFRSGDDMYLFFQSPVGGYLTVYLYDGDDSVYCLLPYQRQTVGQIPIQANIPYIFFSSANARDIPNYIVDEYLLTCTKDLELNRMYVIFSPHLFTKAVDHNGNDGVIPRMLSFKEFHSWLSKVRRQDIDMVINTVDLTISK